MHNNNRWYLLLLLLFLPPVWAIFKNLTYNLANAVRSLASILSNPFAVLIVIGIVVLIIILAKK